MAKTIELTSVKIEVITIDYIKQAATVQYGLTDADGNQWQYSTATFWVTVPDPILDMDGNPTWDSQNWFQLPPSYLVNLTDLRDDAATAIAARFLV